MRERHSLPVRPTARRLTVAVDVVTLSPRDDALAVLLVPALTGARERWSLPLDVFASTLEASARKAFA